MTFRPSLLALIALLAAIALSVDTFATDVVKTARISAATPAPTRFVVSGTTIVDRSRNQPVFFRGIGYSPYLPGETPLYGAGPGDDGRYAEHMKLIRALGVNYLHVFPLLMPKGFFAELDKSDLVYGQDVWMQGSTEDFLDEKFLAATVADIKTVIDHTYSVGRPDRLVLFSIGDELQAAAITRTDTRHPDVHAFSGKHLSVTGRTPTEVALARLIDAAIDYELTRYGRRHLYCHTSWTHVGPLANRPDLEVTRASVLQPDMGDLVCLNVYTYAQGVTTSPRGSATGSAYQGYLEGLAARATRPVLVTQVGLSTSPIAPKPRIPDYGGHTDADVPQAFRAVWKDMRTAQGREKFAGLVFFELQDEWWKSAKDDVTTRHETANPEQWFGLYAVDKDNKLTPKGKIPEAVRDVFSGKYGN